MANRDQLAEQIAAWIGDPAGHARAAEALAEMGNAGIPGLCAYLDRGPQAVPQLRCFALAMLARLSAATATEGLREVLLGHPLKSLSPTFAESEYVVKNDALEAHCARSYPALMEDIACGVRERLRVAVTAAGRFRIMRLADALVDLLDDDVLDAAAMASLVAMGDGAGAAIAPRLDAWLSEATLSARRRLALIRALRVLYRAGGTETAAIRHALDAPHPAVRAAAALLVRPGQRGEALAETLLHGALGFDRGLADDCREALDAAGPALRALAEQALQRDAEPDLYGKLRPLSSEQRGWLVARLHRGQTVRR